MLPITNIDLESACFTLSPSVEQYPLQDDEVALLATSHANEQIYMIVKRQNLREMAEAKN